jgi:hypothetical protein
MAKKSRKILALMLTLVMAFSLFTISGFADKGGNKGLTIHDAGSVIRGGLNLPEGKTTGIVLTLNDTNYTIEGCEYTGSILSVPISDQYGLLSGNLEGTNATVSWGNETVTFKIVAHSKGTSEVSNSGDASTGTDQYDASAIPDATPSEPSGQTVKVFVNISKYDATSKDYYSSDNYTGCLCTIQLPLPENVEGMDKGAIRYFEPLTPDDGVTTNQLNTSNTSETYIETNYKVAELIKAALPSKVYNSESGIITATAGGTEYTFNIGDIDWYNLSMTSDGWHLDGIICVTPPTGGNTDTGTTPGGNTDTGTPTGGNTDTGTPTGGNTDTGTPTGGNTDTGTTPGGNTDTGTTPGGNTDTGTPTGGNTDTGTPTSGTPGTGTPTSGTPGTETPTGGTPSTGTPTSGTPSSGTPTSGTPSTGTPTSGTPSSETPTGVTPSSGNSNTETPKTNIEETAAPTTEAPKTDIADSETPKTETPAAETQTAETPVTDITDPGTPMADAAAQVTGDTLVLWIVLAIASGAALTVMVIDYMRKKNSDR